MEKGCAPSVVTAFFAGTATKVSVYVLMRFGMSIFGYDFSFGAMPLSAILMTLAVAGMKKHAVTMVP